MNDSLILTKGIVKTITNESIQYVEEENQNKEYEGVRFSIGHRTYRSRLAKRTPKKIGYFVAFWEKSTTGKNQAYQYDSSPDKLIISIIDEERKGQFIFQKEILLEKGILRSTTTKGKMGIRVYPSWETSLNKTALNTQNWQKPYFFEYSNDRNRAKIKELYA
ncbi:MepB family protein [Enterococcus phoeniculicola]|jgi:hypothetical protein|uniref:MepB protein n=1 Tax=Enterococcus phoeniculicola ATCC BAA-412 TaxID=1158610 RepID=R3WDZ1_9ENTE|nr:MepB family protein [Enterococcus phoeniculicola]EOL46071.1 hypothetical protein UC3_00876 [Enterococcus phoeniculicola ATCC BAA-412]EOT77084.1 hypothetical protein I589_02046 [Enterococcus phoeniculicola ATCC BAA-412]